MKITYFTPSLLAVGVVSALGLNSAFAAETNNTTPTASAIENIATAVYKVAGKDQPEVQSNKVTVTINTTANFSLVSANNTDANKDVKVAPKGTSTFTHKLSNDGNISDTYTISVKADDDASIVTQTPDYNLSLADNISYTITGKNGAALTQAQIDELTALGQSATGTIANNAAIKLPAGTEATLSYNAVTPNTQEGGNFGVGTISATSSILTSTTLVNENQTLVSLPVFKIEKTAACQSNTTCSSFDVNATDKTIDYTIKVTNVNLPYSVAANVFIIRDVLPKGLTLNGNVTINGAPASQINSAGIDANGRQIINILVPTLLVGSDMTATFKVDVNPAELTDKNNLVNHADIYDRLGSLDLLPPDLTPNAPDGYDVFDTTDISNPNKKTYLKPAVESNEGKDSAPTITLTNRNLAITPGTSQEIPLKDSTVTYAHTITNNGNATEGGATRPITITITDPSSSAPLTITNVYYKEPNGQPVTVTLDQNGSITLPNTVTIAPGATIEIGYNVTSSGTNSATELNLSEVNTVTVAAANGGSSNNASNTTTIKGLLLNKLAAISTDCSAVPAASAYSATVTGTAKPGDCIYYQITATNGFGSLDMTDVTISDLTNQWNGQAKYKAASAIASTGGTNTGLSGSGATEKVSTTFATLNAGASGTLTFAVEVK